MRFLTWVLGTEPGSSGRAGRESSHTLLYLQPMVWNFTANAGSGNLVLVVTLLSFTVPGVVCLTPSPMGHAASLSHNRVPLLILPSTHSLSSLLSLPDLWNTWGSTSAYFPMLSNHMPRLVAAAVCSYLTARPRPDWHISTHTRLLLPGDQILTTNRPFMIPVNCASRGSNVMSS